jgi:hypothetical protein
MFFGRNKKEALFGECKWTARVIGPEVLGTLKEKSALFPQFGSKYYALFSKSGFSAELKRTAAQSGDTLLIDLKALFAG